MTETLPAPLDLDLADQLAAAFRAELDQLGPAQPEPLPRPTWPHLLTTWGDNAGGRHRYCSCGADPAEPGCVEFAQVSRLLVQAAGLIRATGPARRQSSVPDACGTSAARRQRGLAYLALIASAAGEQEAPGPVIGRDALGTSRPSPAFQSVTTMARLAPGASAETTSEPLSERWYAPGWQKPPECSGCGLRHYPRWSGGRDYPRPCLPGDRAVPYLCCRECGYTLDPVAAAEFDGRHAECSLPPDERAYWRSSVLDHGRRRAAAQRKREDTAQ